MHRAGSGFLSSIGKIGLWLPQEDKDLTHLPHGRLRRGLSPDSSAEIEAETHGKLDCLQGNGKIAGDVHR